MSSFKAQIEGSDEVFTFTIQHDATVFNACKVVKAEFEAEEDVVASIFGMKLRGDMKLREVARPDDVILFSSAKGGAPRFSTRRVRLAPVPEGHFRVFTSLSIKSMTAGDVVALDLDKDLSSVTQALRDFVGRQFGGRVPAGSEMQVFLPGGAVFEQHAGLTLRSFSERFPQFRRHLYVVFSRTSGGDGVVEQVCSMKDGRMRSLLCPVGRSSDFGLSIIACFLGYLNLGGPKSREIIYGLSKLFPFAPLINGLYVLSERDTVYEYFLPQITSPLYTIIKEMSGEKDESKVFEHLLEFLPFFGSWHRSHPA